MTYIYQVCYNKTNISSLKKHHNMKNLLLVVAILALSGIGTSVLAQKSKMSAKKHATLEPFMVKVDKKGKRINLTESDLKNWYRYINPKWRDTVDAKFFFSLVAANIDSQLHEQSPTLAELVGKVDWQDAKDLWEEQGFLDTAYAFKSVNTWGINSSGRSEVFARKAEKGEHMFRADAAYLLGLQGVIEQGCFILDLSPARCGNPGRNAEFTKSNLMFIKKETKLDVKFEAPVVTCVDSDWRVKTRTGHLFGGKNHFVYYEMRNCQISSELADRTWMGSNLGIVIPGAAVVLAGIAGAVYAIVQAAKPKGDGTVPDVGGNNFNVPTHMSDPTKVSPNAGTKVNLNLKATVSFSISSMKFSGLSFSSF